MHRLLDRRDQLIRALASDDVDALLVSSPTNVRYLTGFSGEDAMLLVGRSRTVLVSDGRFTTQLEQECPGLEAHIRPQGQLMPEAVAHVVQTLGVRRLGYESAALTMADFEDLRDRLTGVEPRGVRDRVEALRAVKDEGEITAVREAIDIAERAFEHLRSTLRTGDTEKDLADTLEYLMRRQGATCASFPPIIAVGTRSALPHARPSATSRVGDDEFLLVDWGATGRPYKSDLTRMLVTGKVTPKFEKIYRTVLAAQERAIAAVRPGALARDVDAEARSVIEAAGFGRFFDHGLGHGLGMDIHEAPRLRRGSDTPLKVGMIITIEPGIYLPDWGGIRIEDDVLVTPEGCEVLTHVPRSLESVRIA